MIMTTTTATTPRQKAINAVIRLIKSELSAPESALLVKFAQLFYRTVSAEDLEARGTKNLYGAILSLWRMLYQRRPNEEKIRIFNPDLEKDGWTSTHTVIQLAYDDKPFLIDSLRMELSRLGLTVHWNVHLGGVQFKRDGDAQVLDVLPMDSPLGTGQSGAPIYIEIDKRTNKEELDALALNLKRILKDVRHAVEDWQAMRTQAEATLAALENVTNLDVDETELAETKDLLRWKIHDNFIYLGCRDYDLIKEKNDYALRLVPGTGYGVLRDNPKSQQVRHFKDMPPAVRELVESRQILIIAKSNTISTVHRPVHTDYISVKLYDAKGNVSGERRFVGLFTSAAYNSNPKHIPFLRNKVRKVMEMSHLWPTGHAAKALVNILETFPRDDLFQTHVDELYEIAIGILQMQERSMVRMFARKDIYGRFMSCLVYVPRERFNTTLRGHIQDVLQASFDSDEVTYTTSFTDSVLARIHFMIRIDPHKPQTFDIKEIEKQVILVSRSWQSEVQEKLIEKYGEERGNRLADLYGDAFPAGYRETMSAATSALDIDKVETIPTEGRRLQMRIYVHKNAKHAFRFKMYSPNVTTPLSDVIPILENMGLRVIGEEPHQITRKDGQVFWINDFNLTCVSACNIHTQEEKLRKLFKGAFHHIWFGDCEDDRFNHLVLNAELHWREVSVLRGYAKHMQQTGFTYSQDYIAETLAAYPEVTKQLIHYFRASFEPAHPEATKLASLEKLLSKSFEKVTNLDRDRILRRYFETIKATLRTNFFQKLDNGKPKTYISFKLRSANISGLPLPVPAYELFVYSPQFEGVHLRAAKVARGGLRWSDRREDFRTEILGLMKAQQVKNAVIVPQGAKGGFVPKRLPKDGDRDAVMQEGIACYQNFIRGLLDVSDNLKNGKVVKPVDVVCYDEDDPYLVVAADKGTATFSDIANRIAMQYDFWLGDAFASGGSVGYDHKKMGITARGAWESVKRLFRHLGHNTQTEDFTVVGIGDMAGDVFGNGMLLSKYIQLVGAFNHMHIFIDPTPDVKTSYAERKRLFKLPRSAWTDYNTDLISKGGGIFERSAKSIKLTPEIKTRFGIEENEVEPNKLITAMLTAKIDLLWNGGIGTFVKASHEAHSDAGDRTNDLIRVNADTLHCRVIGEGGNLGFTQAARVEFSLRGGHCYTDFIDNAAGVDCSDHEVNIKILLNDLVAQEQLTLEQRNELLACMGDEVAELVLANNYFQTQALEISMHGPEKTVEHYRRYIGDLERNGQIDRALEGLPTDKILIERKTAGQGLTRPELSVLLAYSKNILKQSLLTSDVLEEPKLMEIMKFAFPRVLHATYWDAMQQHSLRREITATLLSNLMINSMGITFEYRLHHETGATVKEMTKAFAVAEHVLGRKEHWLAIEKLDNKVPADAQVVMRLEIYRVSQRVCRWFLKNRRKGIDIAREINTFFKGVEKLKTLLPMLVLGTEVASYQRTIQSYISMGVPKPVATMTANIQLMYPACDLVEQATKHKLELKQLSKTYYFLGERLGLSWLRDKLMALDITDHWQSLARSSLRGDLDKLQCQLSASLLKTRSKHRDLGKRIDAWMDGHGVLVSQWMERMTDLRRSSSVDFTMMLVVMRELTDLSKTSLALA
ncbi:MAG: NAD-glutamate dehydrogenase [marine bacterium B5-7]|nr:MAG: NAD-glutamate dehydrogenase [marine bacterium B5-7]